MNNTEIDFTIGVLKELKAERHSSESREQHIRSCEATLAEKEKSKREDAANAEREMTDLKERLDSVRRKLYNACLLFNWLPAMMNLKKGSDIRKQLVQIHDKAKKFAEDNDVHFIGGNMAE